MKSLMVLLVLGLLVISATACNAAASAPTVEPEPTDDSKLMRLVERLFTHQSPFGEQRQKSDVLVGQMPSDFNVDLSEGSEVIGSVVSQYNTQIVIDAPGAPADVFVRLTEAGRASWAEVWGIRFRSAG